MADDRYYPTKGQIRVALDVLMWLSEHCDDGALRDEIGHVRHELWEEMDADTT
jgi:hypothetical protein